ETTAATVHEVHSTALVQEALVGLGLAPGEHLADAGFITAELLVSSREDRGIELIGPPRPVANWQGRVAGACGIDQFGVDWENRGVRCPEGRDSNRWLEYTDSAGKPYVSARFAAAAMNVSRISDWLEGKPPEQTRTSCFARLAA